ncbi:U2 small nuclear ribonucleoprotein B'' [Diaporthe helianthi]|uniref:U2 small nuclear ribonucleoprotein B n=1 Tax=Diaporthe helianthi TaxID=158607 RepID=A0A2P5HZD6_DIAHE|nr:U2 small nuclear ribonucleoprotein B'' [Diaporthe helianthi]
MAPAVGKAAPPGSGIPPKPQSIPPNQTLYVRGIPSAKIQKEDLRTALYLLFSTYGPVLDVVALKTHSMRGQAHIVYRDIQTATQAMRALDGFDFLGYQMKVLYAKSKSDVVAKLDGTFKIPTSANQQAEMTDLQQSIFNAPPPGTAATVPPAPSGLPTKPPAAAGQATASADDADNRGQKRPREEEEEEEEDSDVAMEEDSDDD